MYGMEKTTWKEALGWILVFIVCLVVGSGVMFAFQGTDFFLYRYFAPKQEAVRRQTFIQSQAFNESVAKDLEDMKRDYAKADTDGKEAIRTMVQRRTSDYDTTQLPADLRSFVEKMRGGY